ncbi:hypothetical protein ATANTOWER_025837 [Ataeniobius toweri]|uniref:Uncharacterized protein n=1 Tax=Ataeniobius toweri TaxID=208326 RepID=A0ABU7CD38_9TELE|nr:hypothetical protein [Ataeniobius toweri]
MPEVATRENPHRSPPKGRVHRAKTKTQREVKTSPPRDQPWPAHPLKPCRPLRPPPPDRTGTDFRNRNPDKEPKSKPEPPRSKRYLSPPKANHPFPPQKKTYTHPNNKAKDLKQHIVRVTEGIYVLYIFLAIMMCSHARL